MRDLRPQKRLLAGVLPVFLGLLLLSSVAGLSSPGDPVPIAPGTAYRQIYRPEGPWAINVVESDLSQKYLQWHSVLGQGATMGRRGVSGMLSSQTSDSLVPVAAVNGDYFAMTGGAYTTIPLGFHVDDGELVTFPDATRSVLYILQDGSAHIDRLSVSAWVTGPENLLYPISAMNRAPEHGQLVLFTPRFGKETRSDGPITQVLLNGVSGAIRSKCEVSATVGDADVCSSRPIPTGSVVLAANGVAGYALRKLKAGDEVRLRVAMEPEVGEIQMAVGGGPRIVRDGRPSVENKIERFADAFAAARHPRTGVGLRDNTVVLVTVDGRQPGYSAGMTLREFAQVFIDMGCTAAMNLDGGGSTTMVVRNRIVNSPSDGQERRVANALALFSTAPATGKPVRLALEPAEADVLAGESLQLVPRGLDEYYNPIPVPAETVQWDTARLGTIDEHGIFVAGPVTTPAVGLVTARSGQMVAASVLRIVPAPAKLAIVPERTTLSPNGTQRFTVRAYDEEGRPIRFSANRVEWSAEPASSGAKIDASGVLHAPGTQAALTVTARIGQATSEARVLVGAVTTVVANFERPGTWRYESTPKGLPGSVACVEDPLKKSNHCLRMDYDFSAGGGTRTAEVVLKIPIFETRTMSVRVLGDGNGGWLRARVRDATDRQFTVDLAPRVDWSKQWRRLVAWLPEDCTPPLTLEAIYLTEYHADQRPVGAVYIDDVGAEAASTKAEKPSQKDNAAAKTKSTASARETGMIDLPTYICRRTPEPITIDGRLDEPVWSRALPVGEFTFTDGKRKPSLPTEVKACWDDRNLYLAFVAIDTDIWGTMRNRDDFIYEEEVVETFLSSGGDVTRYYEFEWSPHNVIFDAKIHCPNVWGDRATMTADIGWNCEGCRSAVQVVGTLDKRDEIDQQWTVEVALPFSEIGRDGEAPVEGEEWRANFYRIDRAGEGESSCWSPTLKRDFHVPARLGRLVFSTQNC